MTIEQLFDGLIVIIDIPKVLIFLTLIIIGYFLFMILLGELKKKYKIWKYRNSGLYEIDRMNGREFEYYLEALFLKAGYNANVTPYKNDYGADVIAYKGAERIVVQAKRWNSKVGVKAVQEIVAARGHFQATDAWVMTNNYFTRQAVELARSNNVRLIDRNGIMSVIKELKKEENVK